MMKFAMVAAATLAAAAVSPAQAGVVIGTSNTENGFPFGSSGNSYYFQQVYSASALGSLNIADLTFYRSATAGSTGQGRTGTFVIYLSTTASAVTDYDKGYVQYPDASFTEVFNGDLPTITDGKLTLNLSSAFNYDAALGNLVLTVREFSLSSSGPATAYFQTDNKSKTMNSRFSAYPYDWDTSKNNFGQGLVTGFNVAAPAVPEPATWALMIVGFGAAGTSLRRRRVATTVSFA